MTLPDPGRVDDHQTQRALDEIRERHPWNSQDIADDAIKARHIGAGEVGASEIATDAVGSDEIAANAVRSSSELTIDGDLNFNSHKGTNLAQPGSNQDAATKKYVDDSIAAGVTFSVPTQTINAGDAASAGVATSAIRADAQFAVSTAAAGSTVNPGDAATEGSATSLARSDHQHAVSTAAASSVSGTNSEGTATSFARSDHNHDIASGFMRTRTVVRAASTANGTLATAFENGDSLDGVTLATGDRVLLKDQSDLTENGIYTVNASGSPTRATDADAAGEMISGMVVNVAEGTTQSATGWQIANSGTITPGTTSLLFTQVFGEFGGSGLMDNIEPDDTASAGTSKKAARVDHRHAIAAGTASTLSGSNAEGSSTSFARADHNHALGGSVGGSLSGTLPNPTIAANTVGSSQISTLPVARVYNTTDITCNNATATKLTFDTERLDSEAIHSTSSNTSRLTCVTAGVYQITGNVEWDSNATGRRILEILLNNTTTIASSSKTPSTANPAPRQQLTTIYKLAATDYVELQAYQDGTTGPVAVKVKALGNYSPEFMMHWLGDG